MHRKLLTEKVFAVFFAGKSAKRALAMVSATLAAGILSVSPALGGPPLEGVFQDNFSLMEDPVRAPQSEVKRLDGTRVSLSDFQGGIVLLNFWATWCAPCLREMPSLERLQAALQDRPFQVVAVSTDRGGAPAVKPFLARLGLEKISILLDEQSRLAADMGLRGLPTTYLLDAEGRVIGGMEGPAEWDSPEARKLVEYYLDDLDRPRRAAN